MKLRGTGLMIKYIDISNFGSFRNFFWSNSIKDKDNDGNTKEFKRLNIIYGRNYSGKTTLSRIFRSLQTGTLPDKYKAPSFSVFTSQGLLTQNDIPANNLDIRVYNKDFVDEHLSFLRDNEGIITPFAVLGEVNKRIEKEIEDYENKLGSIDNKTGLRYEFENKAAETQRAQIAMHRASEALRQRLIKKASRMKHNTLYEDPNYNVRTLQTDIKEVFQNGIIALTEKEKQGKENLLGESQLPDIKERPIFTPNFVNLIKDTKTLLTKNISPSQPIRDLLDDALLQAWVKEGISHHKGKRTTCGFCGAILQDELWAKLEAHFNKESADLEEALLKQIKLVENEKTAAAEIRIANENKFYFSFKNAYADSKALLEEELTKYQKSLDSVIECLQKRLENIFTPYAATLPHDKSEELVSKITIINEHIAKNNSYTKSLHKDQIRARKALRLSEVASFIKDINYESEEKALSEQEKQVETMKQNVDKLKAEIVQIEKKIEQLRKQLKDEKRGAEKVNKYLNHYFGHKGLRLEAIEDTETSAYKFQIMRGDDLAYNLSEGECSLVSFCYFIAKLSEPETSGKKLIIYIDDPVSSLDSNHIFFVFAIIESIIVAPERDADNKIIFDSNNKKVYGYEQLFVSTHNLEFLKYLKKLSLPKNDNEQFLVIGSGGKSNIELMPSYLRNYITEFNHLFSELYTCINPVNKSTHHHCFYNFGNILRRFLEAYLFFKYPFSINDQEDYNCRIRRFFDGESGTDVLVQRLTNEYSHLGSNFDRSAQPIDHLEISEMAKLVLKTIKQIDQEQFKCLLESIGKPDPFE